MEINQPFANTTFLKFCYPHTYSSTNGDLRAHAKRVQNEKAIDFLKRLVYIYCRFAQFCKIKREQAVRAFLRVFPEPTFWLDFNRKVTVAIIFCSTIELLYICNKIDT